MMDEMLFLLVFSVFHPVLSLRKMGLGIQKVLAFKKAAKNTDQRVQFLKLNFNNLKTTKELITQGFFLLSLIVSSLTLRY